MQKSSLYKGCLEPIVFQLLEKHHRMYGYEITQKVKEITLGELQVTEGALYPLLHRLEAEGLLEAEMESFGNRVRKYYRLTETGKHRTRSVLAELQTFVQTLQLVVNPKLS